MNMLRLFLVLTFFTGVAYPLAVTLISQGLFYQKANGSLIKKGSAVVGSELLAQSFKSDKFFHPRPSASDYATLPSGATNLSVTSEILREKYRQIKAQNPDATDDALSSSGSGLDPHISVQNANSQAPRIAMVRGIPLNSVLALIKEHVEGPQLGTWGQFRVNVLKLNLEIEKQGMNANTR